MSKYYFITGPEGRVQFKGVNIPFTPQNGVGYEVTNCPDGADHRAVEKKLNEVAIWGAEPMDKSQKYIVYTVEYDTLMSAKAGEVLRLKQRQGGKREGAGRPVGTTKEAVKKQVTFRLSEAEEDAVRSLLKQMRKKND